MSRILLAHYFTIQTIFICTNNKSFWSTFMALEMGRKQKKTRFQVNKRVCLPGLNTANKGLKLFCSSLGSNTKMPTLPTFYNYGKTSLVCWHCAVIMPLQTVIVEGFVKAVGIPVYV